MAAGPREVGEHHGKVVDRCVAVAEEQNSCAVARALLRQTTGVVRPVSKKAEGTQAGSRDHDQRGKCEPEPDPSPSAVSHGATVGGAGPVSSMDGPSAADPPSGFPILRLRFALPPWDGSQGLSREHRGSARILDA